MLVDSFRGAFSMGQSVRQLFNTNDNPGPGSHEIQFIDKPSHPKPVIGNEKKKDIFVDLGNPSPGEYDPKLVQKRSKMITMKGGFYKPQDWNRNFGYQIRDVKQENQSDVGPGQYYKDQSQLSLEKEENQLDYSFLKEIRKDQNRRKKNLSQQISVDENVSNSSYMRVRKFQGIGLLNSSIIRGNRKYQFGEAERFNKLPKLPGPGDYNLDSKQHEFSQSYSMSRQNLQKAQISVPGVGDYELDYDTKDKLQVKFGVGKRKEIFEIDQNIPGPKYMPISVRDNVKIGFTRQKRESFDTVARKKIGPGSNKYYPKIQKLKDQISDRFTKQFKEVSQPCVIYDSMNSSQMKELPQPGPGDYDIAGDILPKNNINFIERYKKKKKRHVNPGPSDYEARSLKQAKNGTIYKSLRFSESKEIVPGPGQYNQKKMMKGRQSSFGIINKKLGISSVNNNVGPGSYEYSQGFSIPKYLLKKK